MSKQAAEKIVCIVTPFNVHNPYQRMLSESLTSRGLCIRNTSCLKQACKVVAEGKNAHILHLHWLVLNDKGNFFKCIARLIRLILRIYLIKKHGVRLVWTVHNYVPHDCRKKWLHLLARRLTAKFADAVIVHSENAKRKIVLGYKIKNSKKIHIIAQQNYIDYYPNIISRDKIRKELNIPADATVFLFLGHIHPYKGVVDLVDAFGKMTENNTFLLIAGLPGRSKAYVAQLRRKMQSQKNIIFIPNFIPDDQCQFYLNVCDVAALPYKDESLNSSAAILVMSFSRAFIAPDIIAFKSLTDEQGAFFYDRSAKNGLSEALKRAQENKKILDHMGKYNYQKALQWSREATAEKTLRVYKSIL